MLSKVFTPPTNENRLEGGFLLYKTQLLKLLHTNFN